MAYAGEQYEGTRAYRLAVGASVHEQCPRTNHYGDGFDAPTCPVRQAEDARRSLELFRTSGPKESTVDFARRVVSALDLSAADDLG